MSIPKSKLLESIQYEVRTFLAGAILFNELVAHELGLNGMDLQCLNLLDLRGVATPGELARCCGRTTGGITLILDRLEKAGYVRREPSPKDRRSTLVRLVPAKANRLHAIYRSKGEGLAQLADSYDKSQLELVLGFFRRANASEETSGAK